MQIVQKLKEEKQKRTSRKQINIQSAKIEFIDRVLATDEK
jgi:phage antirepressor YoqD-like protein